MSTVGFGDISAGTDFGRFFMMLFISIGLVSHYDINFLSSCQNFHAVL